MRENLKNMYQANEGKKTRMVKKRSKFYEALLRGVGVFFCRDEYSKLGGRRRQRLSFCG